LLDIAISILLWNNRYHQFETTERTKMFGFAFLESGDWQYIVLVFLVSIAFVFVCHLIPWDDDYKDDDDESDFR
jgi:hypothetical protein